jgi:uncharacterized membrane protein
MKAMFDFFKVTLIGGVTFLIPIGFLAVVLAKVAIFLSCFFAGLASRTELASRLVRAIDDRLLIVLPGYSALKGRETGNIGSDGEEIMLAPVLARLDDYSQIAFEIERLDGGMVVVFLPGAPDPGSGSVEFMTADRIEPLDLDHRSAAATLKSLDRGSSVALAARPAAT